MHYPCSRDIYLSTTYHVSVYDIIYKILGHTHLWIYTTSDMGEYRPPKKGVELESNL